MTGTSAAVRVVPQITPDPEAPEVPEAPVPGPPEEQPASRATPPASSTAAARTRPLRTRNALVGPRAHAPCTL